MTPDARRYWWYRKGDVIRRVSQIDALGVEYSVYGREQRWSQHKKPNFYWEWLFRCYRLSKASAWNRWVKGARRGEDLKDVLALDEPCPQERVKRK